MPDDRHKIRRLANDPLTLLLSRMSIFIIGGLSIWILSNVSDTRVDVGKILTAISNDHERINTLESRMDAMASEKR